MLFFIIILFIIIIDEIWWWWDDMMMMRYDDDYYFECVVGCLLGPSANVVFRRIDQPAESNDEPKPLFRVDCRRAEGCPGGFMVGRGAYAYCSSGQRHVARGNR